MATINTGLLAIVARCTGRSSLCCKVYPVLVESSRLECLVPNSIFLGGSSELVNVALYYEGREGLPLGSMNVEQRGRSCSNTGLVPRPTLLSRPSGRISVTSHWQVLLSNVRISWPLIHDMPGAAPTTWPQRLFKVIRNTRHP